MRGQRVTSTVDVIAVVADSVARAPIQNLLQFNGFFGCSWCEDPGETFNHTHVYKFEPTSILRTKENVDLYAARAEMRQYPVMGVLGYSVLNELPGFNRLGSNAWVRSRCNAPTWYFMVLSVKFKNGLVHWAICSCIK